MTPAQAAEFKGLLEQQQTAFAAFKAANDERIVKLEARLPTAEAEAKVQRIETDLQSVQAAIDKLALEEKLPSRIEGQDLTPEDREHRDAFQAMLRNPKDPEFQARLKKAANSSTYASNMAQLFRAEVNTSTGAGGGYLVPEIIDRNVRSKLQDISDMRSLVEVVQAGSPDYKRYVDVNGESYEWVGEGDTRNDTDNGQFAEVAPTFGMIQSRIITTEESLEDMFIDVESWIVGKSAIAHAKGEGVAIISGNGTKKPTGFLNGSPVTTNDEELVGSPLTGRAFGTLQYIATGSASGFLHTPTGSPQRYGGDKLLDVVYALKAGYRRNATWLANKSTLAVVRKFKDVDGNYIWQPSMQLGQPNILMGYAVREMEDMPDLGSNAFAMAFGDFREGYLLVDLAGTRITIDPFTTPGKVKFYIRRRVGGKIQNDDAIKLLKCATS